MLSLDPCPPTSQPVQPWASSTAPRCSVSAFVRRQGRSLQAGGQDNLEPCLLSTSPGAQHVVGRKLPFSPLSWALLWVCLPRLLPSDRLRSDSTCLGHQEPGGVQFRGNASRLTQCPHPAPAASPSCVPDGRWVLEVQQGQDGIPSVTELPLVKNRPRNHRPARSLCRSGAGPCVRGEPRWSGRTPREGHLRTARSRC